MNIIAIVWYEWVMGLTGDFKLGNGQESIAKLQDKEDRPGVLPIHQVYVI